MADATRMIPKRTALTIVCIFPPRKICATIDANDEASDPPFASAQRYAFSRGLVPGIDAFGTQAIAHASSVGEKSLSPGTPVRNS